MPQLRDLATRHIKYGVRLQHIDLLATATLITLKVTKIASLLSSCSHDILKAKVRTSDSINKRLAHHTHSSLSMHAMPISMCCGAALSLKCCQT